MKKIVFTGGGTAGHVIPNIALINALKENNTGVEYIGSYHGIEKELINNLQIPYHAISSGKLRRYFDWQNFTDPLKVLNGIRQAFFILGKIKPSLVFSKGGFVTVPVIMAAYLRRIPVIIHESDMTPGLANKIALPFATRICTSFPETLKYLPSEKAIWTGTPIRPELKQGEKNKGLTWCGFNHDKPVLLIIGGSLGSEIINKAIWQSLPELLNEFQLVHICGKDNLNKELINISGYRQYEYIDAELADIFAMADLVISRAGATAIFEFLELRKPHLLIPLSRKASRGDQILNAASFQKQEYSMVIQEEDLNHDNLIKYIRNLYKQREKYISKMADCKIKDSIGAIISLINHLKKD